MTTPTSGHARAARSAVTAFLASRADGGGAPGFEDTIDTIRVELGLTVGDVPPIDPDCIESGVYRGNRARRWPYVAVVWEGTDIDNLAPERIGTSTIAVYVALPDSRVTGDASNAGLAGEVYADALTRMMGRGAKGSESRFPGPTLNGATGVLFAQLDRVQAGADPSIAAGENVTIKASVRVRTVLGD